MLNEKLQVILVLTSIIGLILIFRLVKRKMLTLKYSILWILMGFIMLMLSIFPELVNEICQIFGVQLGSNALFLIGIYFLLFLAFSLTVIVSIHAVRMRRLNQEVALLKKQVGELEQ